MISSFCATSGCVDVVFVYGNVYVSDTKDDNGPVLMFNREEWDDFIKGVKAGEFDGE